MQRISVLPGVLAAVLVVPLVAGCSALGLPATPAELTQQGVTGAAVAASPAAEATPTRFSSNDGYVLTLPPGWVGVRSNGATDQAVLETLLDSDPLLGSRASALLEATDADLSMVGTDAIAAATGTLPPSMAILVVPSTGRSDDADARLSALVATLPTDGSPVAHSVISVRAGDADRFDLVVAGDQLVMRLRVYLFTIGDDDILVLFGSDTAAPAKVGTDIDAIVKSLRFGV